MAKNKVSEWSSTAANNTDIGGIDIAEGCAPSGINNAIRELMAQVKDQQAGTDGDNLTVGGNLTVTGTTTLIGTPTAPTAATATNTTQIATTEFVQTALRVLYPVGSIYSSTVSTNPNTLLGFGTWVAFGAGRVLIGNGGGFTAGATGGSADAVVVSHTHTATSSVTDSGHAHNVQLRFDNGGGDGYSVASGSVTGSLLNLLTPGTNTATTGITVGTTITSAGVSATNANLQPYVVVYMWNRTV
jgi:hypothetical protein